MTDNEIHPLSALLRRYSYAYTASHDMSMCESLMVDDYELQMGTFTAKGRDESYIPATERQYRQYPGLGFTVHDLVNNGERAALRFTEHGRSVLGGRTSAWRGISMYRWDGSRLTHCRVEQDYLSRTRQTQGAATHEVPSPALDPWTGTVSPADPGTETAVRDFLGGDGLLDDRSLVFDAEDVEPDHDPGRVELGSPRVKILDLFTSGARAAVHLSIDGDYAGGLGPTFSASSGCPAVLHATGILQVGPAGISGHLVSDRLALSRRLGAGHRAPH